MPVYRLQFDAGVSLKGEKPLEVEASLWLPAKPQSAPAVLVCLAGGNMNRRYFDLRPEDGDDSFSFAAQMTRQGFIVAALDHLGLGGSTKPKSGYALTPELLTQANTNATATLLDVLHGGTLDTTVPSLRGLRSIGVGHSMGAMMTVLQQASAKQHSAIALLGFSTRGLPEYLPAEVRDMTPEHQRARLVELAKAMFVVPYPVIKPAANGAELYGSAKAEARGIAALKAATDCLLPVPAYMSMLPGNVAPEARQIDVPLFLGLGERDMAGPPEQIPAAFAGSPAVTLYVQPEAGHSHFLFPTRLELFSRLGAWAKSVTGAA